MFIQGLHLEGASWDSKRAGGSLKEAEPGVLTTPMPVMHVSAVKRADFDRQYPDVDYYTCPVYSKQKPRLGGTALVTTVKLRSTEISGTNKWVLRGVALLCSLE